MSAWAQWTTVSSLSLPRQETAAAIIGDVVYVCGGIISGSPTTNTATVEAYNIVTDTWTTVAPMPLALDHAAAAAVNGKLYLTGGDTRSGGVGTRRDEVHIYDPGTDTWSAGTALPQTRSEHGAVTLNGKIYVMGGLWPFLWEFDPGTDNWTWLASMTESREHINVVTDGTYIYAIGGRDNFVATSINERYDPGTDTWTTMAPLPTARSAMAMAYVGGEVHCIGGEIPMLFDVHEVYDIATNTWSTRGAMPLPRHGVAAVTVPSGLIFVPAGGTFQGVGPTAHADVYGQLPLAVPAMSNTMLPLLGIIAIALSLVTILRRKHARITQTLTTQ
jgi:hypothetical protein